MVKSSGKGGGWDRVAKAARRSATQSTCCQVVKARRPEGRRMRWLSVFVFSGFQDLCEEREEEGRGARGPEGSEGFLTIQGGVRFLKTHDDEVG